MIISLCIITKTCPSQIKILPLKEHPHYEKWKTVHPKTLGFLERYLDAYDYIKPGYKWALLKYLHSESFKEKTKKIEPAFLYFILHEIEAQKGPTPEKNQSFFTIFAQEAKSNHEQTKILDHYNERSKSSLAIPTNVTTQVLTEIPIIPEQSQQYTVTTATEISQKSPENLQDGLLVPTESLNNPTQYKLEDNPIYKKYMDQTKQKEYADAQWYIKNLLEYMQDPDQDGKNTKEKWGLRLFSGLQFFNPKYVYNNLEKLPADLLYLLLYEVKDHSGKTALELLDENPNFYTHKDIVQLSTIAKNRIYADQGLSTMIKEIRFNEAAASNNQITNIPSIESLELSIPYSFNDKTSQLLATKKAPYLVKEITDNIAGQVENERFTTSQSADDVIASYKKEFNLLSKEREALKAQGITDLTASMYNILGQKMQEVADQITADSSPIGKAALELAFKEQALEKVQQALRITNNAPLRDAVLDKQIDYQKIFAQLNYAAMKHPDYQSQKDYFHDERIKASNTHQKLQDYKQSYKKMFDDAFLNIQQSIKPLPKNVPSFYRHIEPSYTMPAYMIQNSNNQKNSRTLLKDLKKLQNYLTKILQKLFGNDQNQKALL